MIFELMEECNDRDTVTVVMDNNTFNQIHKFLVVEAFHMGQHEPKESEEE